MKYSNGLWVNHVDDLAATKGTQPYTSSQQLAGLVYHHTAWITGYISRKTAGMVVPYTGRYGTGVIWLRPSDNSTRYALASYYLK